MPGDMMNPVLHDFMTYPAPTASYIAFVPDIQHLELNMIPGLSLERDCHFS